MIPKERFLANRYQEPLEKSMRLSTINIALRPIISKHTSTTNTGAIEASTRSNHRSCP
jgi:hypothetical protein